MIDNFPILTDDEQMISKPALSDKKLISPKSWKEIPGGKQLLLNTNETLAPYLQRAFGYHLLKLGHLSDQLDTDCSPIKHQFSQAEKPQTGQVRANFVELPFLEQSIDCVLMAHVLDFCHDPHQVIREANRVLIANGYFIYVGINPFSYLGLRRYLPFLKCGAIKDARCFSKPRVKDWLSLLGMEIIGEEYVFVKQKDVQEKGVLRTALNWSGPVYILVAKKREIPLSLIKPKWKIKPKFAAVKA